MKVYSNWIINHCWYLACDVDEVKKTCTIHHHFRRHGERDTHPDTIAGEFLLKENSDRMVVCVKLADAWYSVTNPKHVFGYGDGKDV